MASLMERAQCRYAIMDEDVLDQTHLLPRVPEHEDLQHGRHQEAPHNGLEAGAGRLQVPRDEVQDLQRHALPPCIGPQANTVA